MSTGTTPGEHGDVLDWLYARGKRRADQVPGFDAEKLMDGPAPSATLARSTSGAS